MRVIHIEDQEQLRNLIGRELKKFPADVELVASFVSTEEAEEYLIRLKDENKDLPDMIVSDNNLGAGKRTGIQFAKDLKEQKFEIPFILFTNDISILDRFSKRSITDIEKDGLTRVVDKVQSTELIDILKEINTSSNTPQNKPK